MSPKKKPASGLKVLRQKAEVALKSTRTQVKKMTPEEVQQLVHELQAHQIELEMQNEELRRTQVDLEVARDRYASLYDFTPVGYVTLNNKGQILEANLTFCHWLGLSRRDIIHEKLEKYVDPDDQGALYAYLDTLNKEEGTHTSDVLTLQHTTKPHRVRLEGCQESLDPHDMPRLFRIAVDDVTILERIEIEAAQAEQKALMEEVVDGVMDAIVSIDEDERIVLFNQAAETMFGCSASSVLGQPINRFIPERYRGGPHRHIRQFGENLEASRKMGAAREIYGFRANGKEFPVEATISQVKLKGKGKGKGKGSKLCTVVLRDITDRKKGQEILRKEQQFVTTIFETAAALIVVVDPQGRILRFNRACEKLTGLSFEEVRYKHFADILLPDSEKEGVNAYFQAFLQGQGSSLHENYWLTRDEQLHWITWSNAVIRNERGEPEYLIATGIDLTAQRNMQETLEKERKFVSQVLDTTGALVVILGPHLQILRMNRACKQMARFSPQELEGQPFMNLCVTSGEDDHVVRQLVESCRAGRLPPVFEATLLNQSGQVNWIQWETTTINDEEGKVKYFIATGTDITLRKQAEQNLVATHQGLAKQKEELKSLTAQLINAQEEERRRISRDLHDDVNQRLALLSFKLEGAQQELPESHPLRQSFKDLYQDVATLSDDVRSLAYQYHPSILDDLGLEAALRSLINDFSRWEGLPVTLHAGNMPNTLSPEVASCLYRAAQEGLRNISRHAHASNVQLELRGGHNGLTLSLHDDGQGFHPHERQSGGLGLVSMGERVQLVNGNLRLESQPGQGTTVWIWVPLGEPKP